MWAAGRLLALHTPGGSHERFLEEAGALVAGGGDPVPAKEQTPRATAFVEVAARYGIEICEAND